MAGIPTVVIKTENGPVVINASEFDPKKHTLYDEAPKQTRRTRK